MSEEDSFEYKSMRSLFHICDLFCMLFSQTKLFTMKYFQQFYVLELFLSMKQILLISERIEFEYVFTWKV